MKIAVIGAGAIGGLVAGYLKSSGEDVCLVGRADSVAAIRSRGLRISGVRGEHNIKIPVSEELNLKPDLVILATKTQDLSCASRENRALIRDALVVTTQNGIRADEIVAEYVPEENIISSIVMFGSTYLEPGNIVHNFEGSWIIGRISGKGPDEKEVVLSLLLTKVFPTIISEDIKGMKYLKIFVNANNCLPAILGISMQEAFKDLDISRISINIWKEGFEVISKAGIGLVSLPGFPLENVTKLTSLPSDEAAAIFSGIMSKLSKEPLYGSILQSIKRDRSSEIEYLNGEFVRAAKETGMSAPLNEKLVELVHSVERNREFLSKQELLDSIKGILN